MNSGEGIIEGRPVVLASLMNVNIMVNESSKVWVLHDKPLPDLLKWVEYDCDRGCVSLVTDEGLLLSLGLELPQDIKQRLEKAQDIYVVRMKDEHIDDFYHLPLLVHDVVH